MPWWRHHAMNWLAPASFYAVLERAPGSAWLKAMGFANGWNVILYPITLFEDIHLGDLHRSG